MKGTKGKENPLEFTRTYDFFSGEEGDGAIILYTNQRLEALTFQEMREKEIFPTLIEYLQDEYLRLFGKGQAWPL